MFEKVNPCHPDKVADRIAGAVVDLAYKVEKDPRIAVEVLIGHGVCHIIAETSAELNKIAICQAVHRITNDHSLIIDLKCVRQDVHLANNQSNGFRCGDNGIFKGVPVTAEQKRLTAVAKAIFNAYERDGKYIADGDKLVICQSHAKEGEIKVVEGYKTVVVNPLGY
jgi:S-adenosylmethionine synthetase